MILKAEIEDLKNKLLLKTQAHNDEIEAHARTRGLLADAEADKASKSSELAVLDAKNSRLDTERTQLREDMDQKKEEIAELTVKNSKLQSDNAFYKEDADRKEDIIDKHRKQIAELKESVASEKRRANDESAKRAELAQRAQNAEEGRNTTLKETAVLTEDLTKARQDVYDLTMRLSNQAKNTLQNQRLIEDLRKTDEEKTKTIRELKKKLSKIPKKIIVR